MTYKIMFLYFSNHLFWVIVDYRSILNHYGCSRDWVVVADTGISFNFQVALFSYDS